MAVEQTLENLLNADFGESLPARTNESSKVSAKYPSPTKIFSKRQLATAFTICHTNRTDFSEFLPVRTNGSSKVSAKYPSPTRTFSKRQLATAFMICHTHRADF